MSELPEKLRQLKSHMVSVATDLHELLTLEGEQHSQELASAAAVVGEWADTLETLDGADSHTAPDQT